MIEQLVNLLAAAGQRAGTALHHDIQVTGRADKNKTIQVRLALAGVVSKKIALEKKSGDRYESQVDAIERGAGWLWRCGAGVQLYGRTRRRGHGPARVQKARIQPAPPPPYTPLPGERR